MSEFSKEDKEEYWEMKKEIPLPETVRGQSIVEKHRVNIPYEITKLKTIKKNGLEVEKRVVIKRGTVKRDATWLYWPKLKRYYWNNLSELDYDPQAKEEKLIYDVNFSEPFDSMVG